MAPKELGHTMFSFSAVNCEQTESRSEGDGHLRRVSDEQGVELSFGVSWEGFGDVRDETVFFTQPHRCNDPQEWRS